MAAVRGRADAVGARSSLPLVRRIVAKPSHGKRLTRHSGQQDLEQHKAGVSKPTRKAKLAHLRVGVDLKPAVPPAVATQTSDAYNPRTGLWECPRGCGYTCAKRQGLGGHNHKGRCPLFPTSRGRCEATGGQSAIRRAPSPAASETAEATSTSDTNSPTCRDDERHVVRQHGRRELGEEGEDGEGEDAAHDARRASGRPRAQIARYIAEPAPDPHALRMAVLAAKEREAREREGMGHDGHHGIGMSSGKASMLTHALTSVDARAAVRAEHGASSAQPSLPSEVRGALLEENARRRNGKGGACHGPLRVEEYGLDDAGFGEAKAEAGWELIDGWANTRPDRIVVRRWHLRRLYQFSTKILLVRAADGQLVGCALLSEAQSNTDVCDTLHTYRNPSLPEVRTARMADYGPIQAKHVRSAFERALGCHPIDELVLICGEKGVGGAVMGHLRGRPRILFASVVAGSERTRRFYDKYFVPLPFERRDGEAPYAAWLGDA